MANKMWMKMKNPMSPVKKSLRSRGWVRAGQGPWPGCQHPEIQKCSQKRVHREATCTPAIPVENLHQLDGGRGFCGVWGVRGNGERCSGFGVSIRSILTHLGVKILTPQLHGLMMLGKLLHLTNVSLFIYRPMLTASLSLI